MAKTPSVLSDSVYLGEGGFVNHWTDSRRLFRNVSTPRREIWRTRKISGRNCIRHSKTLTSSRRRRQKIYQHGWCSRTKLARATATGHATGNEHYDDGDNGYWKITSEDTTEGMVDKNGCSRKYWLNRGFDISSAPVALQEKRVSPVVCHELKTDRQWSVGEPVSYLHPSLPVLWWLLVFDLDPVGSAV